jgi:hypothetical protein
MNSFEVDFLGYFQIHNIYVECVSLVLPILADFSSTLSVSEVKNVVHCNPTKMLRKDLQ